MSSTTLGVFGVFGVGNFGNEASLAAFLSAADARGRSQDIIVACEDPIPVRKEHKVATWSYRTAGPRRSPWGKAWQKTRHLARIALFARGVQEVVVPGTGILEGEWIQAGGIPLTLLALATVLRLRRRPITLLSVGVDTRGSWMTNLLFALTLMMAGPVTVRDARSARAVRRLSRRRVQVQPDLAFFLADAREYGGTPSPTRPTIALGVMDYFGPTLQHDAQAHQRYLQAVDRTIDALCPGHDIMVIVGAEPDLEPARQVVAAAHRRHPGAPVRLASARNFTDLVAQLRAADVVAASRYHNLLAGLCAAVPVVSMGYGPKHEALMQEFGLAPDLPLATIDSAQMTAAIRAALADAPANIARIEKRLATLRPPLTEQFRQVLGDGTQPFARKATR